VVDCSVVQVRDDLDNWNWPLRIDNKVAAYQLPPTILIPIPINCNCCNWRGIAWIGVRNVANKSPQISARLSIKLHAICVIKCLNHNWSGSWQ